MSATKQPSLSEVLSKISALEAEHSSVALASSEKKTTKSPMLTSEEYKRMNRRERKNAQSRARAAKLREKIHEVKFKADETKSEEEIKILQKYEARRRRKNERSRERTVEKKRDIQRILATPEKNRTEKDKEILSKAIKVKEKKNRGDRLRRERMKVVAITSGKATKNTRGRPKKKIVPSSDEAMESSAQNEPARPEAPSALPVPSVPPVPPALHPLALYGQPHLSPAGMFSNQLLVPILPKNIGVPGASIPSKAVSSLPLMLASSDQAQREMMQRSQLLSQQLHMSSLNLGLLQSVGSDVGSRLLLPVTHPQPNIHLYRTNVGTLDNGKGHVKSSDNGKAGTSTLEANEKTEVNTPYNGNTKDKKTDNGKDEEEEYVNVTKEEV